MPKSQRIKAVILVALCALGVLLASVMGVARADDATELSRFLDRDLPSFGYDGALAGTTTVPNTRAGALRDYDAPRQSSRSSTLTSAGRSATKAPGRITGYAINRGGVRHGLEQAMGRNGGRGVSPRAMLDAVRNNPGTYQEGRGTWLFKGDDAVVVLNQRGQVVTTHARGRPGLRNPSYGEPSHQINRPSPNGG